MKEKVIDRIRINKRSASIWLKGLLYGWLKVAGPLGRERDYRAEPCVSLVKCLRMAYSITLSARHFFGSHIVMTCPPRSLMGHVESPFLKGYIVNLQLTTIT